MKELIDAEFSKLIARYRIHQVLGITPAHVKVLRHQLRHGQAVSMDKKLKLLARTGWDPCQARWTDQDLVDLLKLYEKSGQVAREFGPAYILEKFKAGAR